MNEKTCSVDQCAKRVMSRGFCSMHYSRWLKYGDVNYHYWRVRQIPICKIEGCETRAVARGWCRKHYTRWQRHGDPLHIAYGDTDQEARFWSKVDRRGEGECWPWLGVITSNGYGQHSIRGKRTGAHRFAYEIAKGPIPEGLTIDHVRAWGCTRTDCVNPNHLEAVTLAENLRRSDNAPAVNRRKSACPKGHEYTQRGNGERRCLECGNKQQRDRRAARRKDAA